MPDSFHVTLTRTPRDQTRANRYAEHVHPEAHDLDAMMLLKRKRRLPTPEPDYVWYKWSRPTPDGESHYLGDDRSNWRTSPQDPGDRPRRDRRRPPNNPPPKPPRLSGSLQFTGWNWLCPACGQSCRTLYLPLPPMQLFIHDVPRLARIIDIPRKIETFACRTCHRVRPFSRVAHDSWNTLVSYLSAGLLYGHEVPRPPEFTKSGCAAARKVPYKPRANARPSLRREQVAELLVQGLTYAEIARRLGVKPVTMMSYARRVYAYHNVHGRAALAKKLGRPDPRPTMRSKVQKLMEMGFTNAEIATQLHLPAKTVTNHTYCIRRRKGLTKVLR